MNTFFEDGARVAFVGDSITATGLFISDIFEYYRKEFPEKSIKLFNCGVPGDNATAAYKRLEKDVARYQPNEVVIMFGMNDVGRDLYVTTEPTIENLAQREKNIARHVTAVVRLIEYFSKKDYPITLCSVSPVDEVTENETPLTHGLCEAFKTMFSRIKEAVVDYNIKLWVDFTRPLEELLHACNGNYTFINSDRVHPNEVGHEIMSRIFLKAQGFDVDIPAASELVSHSEKLLTKHSHANCMRMKFENSLRNLMFIEWNVSFGQENMTEKEKIAYWEKNAEEFGKISEYHKSCAFNYFKNKKNEGEYFDKIMRYTDEMVNN